jgi:hypothetical protein
VRWPGHIALAVVGRWQAGPVAFLISSRFFHLPNFEIQNSDLPDVQNLPNFLHWDSWKHKEQLSFLAQLQIPSGFQVTNFGTNSNLNFP